MAIGIVGIEFYTPNTFVSQEELETENGVDKGKYTIGLGQEEMAFCDLSEDIVSMSMTALEKLMKRYKIDATQIGRLEVGTETVIDKAKSVKSGLMQMLEGNTNIEGVDTINACYGGTSAFFNSLAWLNSIDEADNRYAIVITGDIAVYDEGPARPTGGAGVVAILLGKNAPITLDKNRWTHMENAYDFYKPNLDSEYPVVDGNFSNKCYINALNICYKNLRDIWLKECKDFNVCENVFNYNLFHMPYAKLVNKSYTSLYFNDWLSGQCDLTFLEKIAQHSNRDSSLITKVNFQRKLQENLKSDIIQRVLPGQLLGKRIGNIYTGSLYLGLLSLISSEKEKLQGQRALLFSYGSGLASSMFSMKFDGNLSKIIEVEPMKRLDKRVKISPSEYNFTMLHRRLNHTMKPFTPKVPSTMRKGTWYLSNIDRLGRRSYARKLVTFAKRLL